MAVSKKTRFRFWSALLLCLFLLGLLEVSLRIYGLPRISQVLLEEHLAQSGLDCRISISWGEGSLFNNIILKGVSLQTDTPLGPICLQAQEINTGISLLRLWQKRFTLDNFQVSGGKLLLLTPSGQDIYQAEQMSFLTRRQGDHSWNAKLFFSLRGIQVRGELQLEHCPDLLELLASLGSNAGEISAEQLRGISQALESLSEILQKCEFGSRDANISFIAHCDGRKMADSTVNGDFDLNYSRIDEIIITKQRGQFSYARGELHGKNLHWLLNHDERLNAAVRLNLNRKSIEAKFQGRLRPETLLSLTNPWRAVWPDFLTCPLPFDFQGELPETDWSLAYAAPTLQGTVEALTIFGSTLPQTSFTLRRQEQNIILEDVLLAFDYHQNRFVRGGLNWNYQQKLLSGELSARLNLGALLKNHGLTESQTWLSFADWDDTRIDLQMQESALSWSELRLQGHLREQHWREFNCSIYSLSLPFSLENGILSLEQATAGLDNPYFNNLAFSGQLDIPAALQSQIARPSFEFTLRPRPGEKVVPAQLSGIGEFDYSAGTLAIHQGRGSLLPERLLAEFPRLQKIIPLQLEAQFACSQPIELEFSLPSFPWNKPQAGKILLHGQGKEIFFNGLAIHTLSTEAEITLEETRFLNIQALINDDEMVSLDLLLKHNPPLLNISNAIVEGRPEFIEAFIFSPTAREIYHSIWQDVSWDPTQLPIIYIPSMLYYEDALNDNNWILQLESDFHITAAAYKSFPVPRADLSLQLQLPDELTIAPIVLYSENGDIRAQVNCSFAEIPHCEFSVEETECSPDTILLLQSIDDDWKEFLKNFTLHEAAKIRCRGAISFVTPPTLKISGRLTSPECTYRNFLLRDLAASWNYSSDKLFWDVTEADFLSAAVQTTGWYDFQAHSGETLLRIRNLPLQEANELLFPDFNGQSATKLSGRLNSDCRLKMLRNWAGMPIYLEGDGHLTLREADLWRVPLMGSLSAILSLGTMNIFSREAGSNLGTISEMKADLNFKGTRVIVPNFETNGTFISLSGSGEYSWLSDNLHFSVQGHALRNVNILSFMLKPLSWAFDAELQGTSKKPEWKIRNPFSRVFSTE